MAELLLEGKDELDGTDERTSPVSLGRSLARAGLLLLLALPCRTASGAETVVITRGEPQLFVDDKLIAESHALHRTLRQPRKDGGGLTPVLAIPQSFGRQTALQAIEIVYDPHLRLWVMFCQARRVEFGHHAKGSLCQAVIATVSRDGVTADGRDRDDLWRVAADVRRRRTCGLDGSSASSRRRLRDQNSRSLSALDTAPVRV